MPMNRQAVTFTGSQGEALAGILDLPPGPVKAVALFAHCFTCSKNVHAAVRIAHGLNQRGIAVMRFDFTGLGDSDGDFAASNFSANVADLVAAADHLRATLAAPDILIGHSLGGTAVLAATDDIPEARAVATIASPYSAAHVLGSFAGQLDEIADTGSAQVTLGGRSFTIRKQFLDDLEVHDMKPRIAGLKRALMVMHAPRDEIVGIDNATEIFIAARHPKSFVSLDDADHLLTRRRDAAYVADVLASWVSRYLPQHEEATAVAPGHGFVTVSETGEGRYQQAVVVGGHSLLADEPAAIGGLGSGPTPYDLLASALGACTSMTLRMYAERKGLALGPISVKVGHGKVYAKDCADCGEGREGRLDRFEVEIAVAGEHNRELDEKILEIAGKCPVHRTLTSSSVIVSRLAGDSAPG